MTAEELLDSKGYAKPEHIVIGGKDVIKLLQEFAQHHVTEALKAASEKSTLLENGVDTNNFRYFIEKYDSFYNEMKIDINKESILKAYPLTNIK